MRGSVRATPDAEGRAAAPSIFQSFPPGSLAGPGDDESASRMTRRAWVSAFFIAMPEPRKYGAIPRTLHATYTGAVTVPTSVPLVWNPPALRWKSAAFTVCGTGGQFLFLDCTSGVWTLTPGLSSCVQFPNANPTTSPCSPFVLTFNGLTGTCCVGFFTVTITI